MNGAIRAFLSNESRFGRLMTHVGIVVAANLLFVLFSLPLVTGGAALAALYHTMLKTLRGNGAVNPFRAFWTGFRTNFRQATWVWLGALAFAVLVWADLRITAAAGGTLAALRYPLYALCLAVALLLAYFFPTLAAFDAPVPGLLRSSFFFAAKKPWKALVILFFDLFPLYLTASDPQFGPLYAFIWFFFGFGAIALTGAALLLPEFRPYLDPVDAAGEFLYDEAGNRVRAGGGTEVPAAGAPGKSEREILEEMKKLGM